MRLDTERQKKLEPERMAYAIKELDAIGIYPIVVTDKYMEFEFKNESVMFYPYTGWHTGKSIKDGRGLQKLLSQIKNSNAL